jgi:ArsR family transcriptional regulator
MNPSEQLAVQLWAIGDEVRLRILASLPFADDCASRSNVKALSERLEIPQPTISHHLRVLRQAGIVRKSKHCRDCYYFIDAEAGREIVHQLQGVITPQQTVEIAPV